MQLLKYWVVYWTEIVKTNKRRNTWLFDAENSANNICVSNVLQFRDEKNVDQRSEPFFCYHEYLDFIENQLEKR